MKLFQVIIVLVFSGVLFACGGGSNSASDSPTTPPEQPEEAIVFSQVAQEDVTFIQFSFAGNHQLAATNKGIYKQENSQWVLMSDANWYVYDVAIVSDTHFIASIRINNAYELVESIDSGSTWSFVSNDFGGPDRDILGGNEKMNRIKYDSSNGLLYATGFDVLATSNDLGRSWQAVSGVWAGLARGLTALTINNAQSEIWIGGQGAIENPICKQYSMSSNTTTLHNDSISALLPVPSTVDNIVIHPDDPQTIFAMGEGGIVVSNNAGEDWTGFILDGNYRFYYDLVIDPNNTNRMYTAGWSKEVNTPQQLIIERTLDGGVTWENHIHPNDTLYGGVRSIAYSYNQANQLVLHFGLQNGGIINARVTN